jgi:cobalt-zinc-cadmium efflux system protein
MLCCSSTGEVERDRFAVESCNYKGLSMSHSHKHTHATSTNIKLAFALNLVFAMIEIAGGILTNSLAILSDAVHDFGDSISLGLAWFLERYAERDEDHKFSYGYRRFSLLGALINTIILVVGSLLIISRAIPRILSPEGTNAQGMIFFALGGILVNGFAAFRLRGSKSLNARVAAWHLLEDVLGWMAVLVVGIVLLFTDNLYLDPVLSILIAVYILYNVIRNLRETIGLFLQAVPDHIPIPELESQILDVENVKSIHHTHIWSLDGEHHVLSTHVVVDESMPKDAVRCVKDDIKVVLRSHDFSHITLEIEYGEDDCVMSM